MLSTKDTPKTVYRSLITSLETETDKLMMRLITLRLRSSIYTGRRMILYDKITKKSGKRIFHPRCCFRGNRFCILIKREYD